MNVAARANAGEGILRIQGGITCIVERLWGNQPSTRHVVGVDREAGVVDLAVHARILPFLTAFSPVSLHSYSPSKVA